MRISEPRWLLVGSGDIARKRVAAAIQSVCPGGLAAVCDVNKERAEALAHDYGVDRVYSDFDAALARADADAVYVATPVSLHSRQAAAALKAGRHVLVEKPLGLDAIDAAIALHAAEESGLAAGCAYFRRSSTRYASLKAMLDNGALGKIVQVRMTYCSWYNPSSDDPKYWRVQRRLGGGGVLADMGVHMFDVLIGLFGLPARVFATTATLCHSYQVEDSAAVHMTLACGAPVIAAFNWNSRVWSHELEIFGSEGRVRWSPYDSGPVLKTVGTHTQELDQPPAENVHEPLVRDFVAAVCARRDPVAPFHEAFKTNRLLDAVYRSASTKEEVVL
jgi:predicted dehydrogenase